MIISQSQLTLIVADSGKYGFSHDELKVKVEKFLKHSTISPEEMRDSGDMYLDQLREESE